MLQEKYEQANSIQTDMYWLEKNIKELNNLKYLQKTQDDIIPKIDLTYPDAFGKRVYADINIQLFHEKVIDLIYQESKDKLATLKEQFAQL